jgi:hypothetical protein
MSALAGPTAHDGTPAPAAAAPAAAVPSCFLSVVHYSDSDADAGVKPTLDMGISLDDEAIARAMPRQVGNVHVSIVKRASSDAGGAATAPAEPTANAHPPEDEPARAAFVAPDSPPGDVHPRVLERFAELAPKARDGLAVNRCVRSARRFRNPDLLEKLVAYLDVQQAGTNYPAELYDPTAFGPEEYYEQLERARRQLEEQQSREPPQPAASQAPPPGEPAVKRKSKWDTGSDPPPKRPSNP